MHGVSATMPTKRAGTRYRNVRPFLRGKFGEGRSTTFRETVGWGLLQGANGANSRAILMGCF